MSNERIHILMDGLLKTITRIKRKRIKTRRDREKLVMASALYEVLYSMID